MFPESEDTREVTWVDIEELKELKKENERLQGFKKYFDELYGMGLEVANWHQNGDLEPLDEFYESALEAMEQD